MLVESVVLQVHGEPAVVPVDLEGNVSLAVALEAVGVSDRLTPVRNQQNRDGLVTRAQGVVVDRATVPHGAALDGDDVPGHYSFFLFRLSPTREYGPDRMPRHFA